MLLMIDNYDSFTFNLVQYLGELGAEVKVVRNDALTIPEIEALRHAVSERLLKDEGWKTDTEGRILNELGRPIFKPGYVSAIRKVIGETEAPATVLTSLLP